VLVASASGGLVTLIDCVPVTPPVSVNSSR
jgi:hypothetical protein